MEKGLFIKSEKLLKGRDSFYQNFSAKNISAKDLIH